MLMKHLLAHIVVTGRMAQGQVCNKHTNTPFPHSSGTPTGSVYRSLNVSSIFTSNKQG